MTQSIEVKFQGTWEDEDNHRDFDYEVTGTVVPGYPAKVNGPPEKCYPEEPAKFEDWDVELTGYIKRTPYGTQCGWFSNLTVLQKRTLTFDLATHLEENESDLAEQAFNAATEIIEAARERDYP